VRERERESKCRRKTEKTGIRHNPVERLVSPLSSLSSLSAFHHPTKRLRREGDVGERGRERG
jgi:hypothetical protein